MINDFDLKNRLCEVLIEHDDFMHSSDIANKLSIDESLADQLLEEIEDFRPDLLIRANNAKDYVKPGSRMQSFINDGGFVTEAKRISQERVELLQERELQRQSLKAASLAVIEAQEANKIARQSNKLARHANIISLCAAILITPIIAFIQMKDSDDNDKLKEQIDFLEKKLLEFDSLNSRPVK